MISIQTRLIGVFRPKPHSGRSVNLVLNDRRKNVVAFRPLAQVSETILTELTWQVLIEVSVKSLLFLTPLNFWTCLILVDLSKINRA